MEHYFVVDGLLYHLFTDKTNEIFLALAGGESPTYKPEYDRFNWDFEPAETHDIGAMRYPHRIFHTGLKRVYRWLGKERPPHFRFMAETDRRAVLYQRIADRLTRRFPYYLVRHHHMFYFYRQRAPEFV